MRLILPLEMSYKLYRWFKGETINPYSNNLNIPLASFLWEYERNFHISYLESKTDQPLKEAYLEWKKSFINDYLPGKAPNPYGDLTDWEKVFDTGIK